MQRREHGEKEIELDGAYTCEENEDDEEEEEEGEGSPVETDWLMNAAVWKIVPQGSQELNEERKCKSGRVLSQDAIAPGTP